MTGDIGLQLRRGLRRLEVCVVALFVLLAALVVVGYLDSAGKSDRIARDAAQVNGALCALRGDLTRRVDASIAYLEDHPRGAPGIPAATIRQGIENQAQTIHALARVRCH